MPGTSLIDFQDFVYSTRPAFLTGKKDLINEVVRQTYMLGYFLRGNLGRKSLRGGSSIRDIAMFDSGGTSAHYKPNEPRDFTISNFTRQIEVQWRFTDNYMAWTDQQVILNLSSDMKESAQIEQAKHLKYQIEQACYTDLMNFCEDALWANPHGASNESEMEDERGKTPYSIPAFVNEESNYRPSGWTTVAGINPVTETKWRCAREQYDATQPNDADGDFDGLLDGMNRMYHKVKFRKPALQQVNGNETRMDKRIVATSLKGANFFERICRDSNDRLVRVNDPFLGDVMTYGGVPVVYIKSLDTAAIYAPASGSTYVTEEASGVLNSGPRYYCLDGEYLTPIFNSARFFEKPVEPYHPDNQYESWICPVNVWWNLFPRSLSRLGILYPGA